MSVRRALGVIVLLLLVGGGAVWLAPGVDDPTRLAAGAAVRVGLLFGAVWLAIPAISRLAPRTAVPIGVAAVIFALRPRTILWLGPALVVILLLSRPRRNQT